MHIDGKNACNLHVFVILEGFWIMDIKIFAITTADISLKLSSY